MMNQLRSFKNEEFGALEILMIDGKPHFPATECAVALGYRNPYDAIAKHCKGDGVAKREGVSFTTNQHGATTKQTVQKTYITEGNLYRLIIRSNLPTAERFEKWVFDEVLPSIRKHGAYITDAILDEVMRSQDAALDLFRKLRAERGKTEALLDKVEELAPKARYCDLILRCKGALQISIIAKDYGMSAVALNRLLRDLGVQYKVGATWVLYQNHADRGYTKSRTYHTPSGSAVVHTCWTQKGRLFLYERLADIGILPLMESGQPESDQMVLH